jgi:hypothetical protein
MEQKFPLDPESILQALVGFFDSEGAVREVQLLARAQAQVTQIAYDNWNGGTSYYCLHIQVPASSYKQISNDSESCEQKILEKSKLLLRPYPNEVIDEVCITPTLVIDETRSVEVGDLFKHQFPAGLPFGLKKPSLAFIPEHGSQMACFEDEPGVAVIRGGVYPSFTYRDLMASLGDKLKDSTLVSMIQTESEKRFYLHYVRAYDMPSQEVPVLIPQAWIQWHSKTKRDLRSRSSSYADDLYRVDFVAFWKRKRFVILVDDISHYAKRISERWYANEEAYSKRLKEDRKLRKEEWEVFRMSNWELRDEGLIPEILTDLREFIDF